MGDYDDKKMFSMTVSSTPRSQDITPIEYLRLAPHKLLCRAGTCSAYSSIGYEIIGLLLAALSGAKRWEDYNQSAFLTSPSRYPSLAFPNGGPCSDWTKVHQYAIDGASLV